IAASKTPNFFVEVRFGGYKPDVDNGVKGMPYAKVFGSQCPSGATSGTSSGGACTPGATPLLFHFGLEIDVTPSPLRIPYIGAFGLGLGWGFSRVAATANYVSDPNNPSRPGGPSGQTTALTIMPTHASFVLRADEIMRRTRIPIVPYGKFGVGLAFWRASTDTGTEVYDPCASTPVPAVCKSGSPPGAVNGAGLTPSLHFAVGGMLALNFIEPQAAARLGETTGVHHAFVFGEYYNDRLPLASNVMHVGTASWVVGLAVDF